MADDDAEWRVLQMQVADAFGLSYKSVAAARDAERASAVECAIERLRTTSWVREDQLALSRLGMRLVRRKSPKAQRRGKNMLEIIVERALGETDRAESSVADWAQKIVDPELLALLIADSSCAGVLGAVAAPAVAENTWMDSLDAAGDDAGRLNQLAPQLPLGRALSELRRRGLWHVEQLLYEVISGTARALGISDARLVRVFFRNGMRHPRG